MSTDVVTLKGKRELPVTKDGRYSVYSDMELHANTFYGGADRGKSLQLTLSGLATVPLHIQLDNATAKKLVVALKELDF